MFSNICTQLRTLQLCSCILDCSGTILSQHYMCPIAPALPACTVLFFFRTHASLVILPEPMGYIDCAVNIGVSLMNAGVNFDSM